MPKLTFSYQTYQKVKRTNNYLLAKLTLCFKIQIIVIE